MKITDRRGRNWELHEEEGYEAKWAITCKSSLVCTTVLRFRDREDAEAIMFILERSH